MTVDTNCIDREIFDALPAQIAVIDGTGTLVAANRAWRCFGPKAPQGALAGLAVGGDYMAACEGAARNNRAETQAALKGIRRVLDGLHERFELAYPVQIRKTHRWFLLRVTPFPKNGGALITHEEITEQKRTIDELHQVEEVASVLVAAYPDSGALLDADGTVRDISRTTAHSLNTTRQAIIGKNIFDYLPPKLAASRRKWLNEVLVTGQPARFRDIRADRTIDNTIYPICDRQGKTIHLVIYGKDVTDQVRAEAALNEKTRELQTILDALPQMVARTDKNLVYRFVNQTYQKVFHVPQEQIVGRRLPDVIGPDAWGKVKGHVERVLAGKRVIYDETLSYPNGEERQIHGELIPDRNPAEDVTGYFAVLSDVSDLAQSLARAEAREKEQAALLKASRAIYEEATFDTIARKIFDICRETIGARSGYVAMLNEDGSENELLFLEAGGLPCDVDPDLPMPIRGLREQAYRSGRPVYDNDFHHSDWMRLMPQGHVRLDNVLFAPLNVAEKTVGLIGIANKPTDFTGNDARLAAAFAELTAVALQRIQDMAAVRESEARYRALLESSPNTVLLVKQGRYAYINPAGLRLFGLTDAADIIGTDALAPIHPDCRPALLERMARIESGQVNDPIELRVIHRDGSAIHTESVSVSVDIQGQRAALIISRDITEKKRAEEARQKAETELRLLSSRLMAAQEDERRRISAALHDDLGQALMVLKLRLRSALKGIKDGRPTAIDDFESTLGTINDMTENLRRIARELSPAVLENFGLVPALKWLADQYAPHLETVFQDNGVQTSGRLSPEAETAIFRICQEAMTNVIRHAGADRVEMGVEEKNGTLVVSIRDNGRGFDARRTESAKDAPTGLGLLSIFERARLLEARVSLRSEPECGTALLLEVPLKTKSMDNGPNRTIPPKETTL